MGYTHYWYRKGRELPADKFAEFVHDCAIVCRVSEVPLANWNGAGEPQFHAERVAFNGVENCGHAERDLGITWPSKTAQGVSAKGEVSGSWFAGAQLESRTCDGDCSHESFVFPQCLEFDAHKVDNGEYFCFTKTAYKPYDLCVTACLIVANHHFSKLLRISSDGENKDWADARRLCQHVLGYGADFKLEEE